MRRKRAGKLEMLDKKQKNYLQCKIAKVCERSACGSTVVN